MPPAYVSDDPDAKSETTYLNSPEPRMTSTYQHELNDLSERLRGPGATRPRGYAEDPYLTWRSSTQAQSMPGEPQSSKKKRLYATCCCGSPLGMLLWLLVGAGIVAVIVVLLVKAFAPSATGAHQEAASSISSTADRSTTTVTVSPTAPSMSTTTTSIFSTVTETSLSTTTQTITTEEEQTTTITFTPPTTAIETATVVATSISTQIVTTEVQESVRTATTSVTTAESLSFTTTASATETETETETTTATTTSRDLRPKRSIIVAAALPVPTQASSENPHIAPTSPDATTGQYQPTTADLVQEENAKPLEVGTCTFFAGKVDCVKHHNLCWGSLVGVGIASGLLVSALAWLGVPAAWRMVKRRAEASAAAPSTAAAEQVPYVMKV